MTTADPIAESLATLPKPVGWFGSDNQSGAHPEVLAAMVAANTGYASGYGGDPWTDRCNDLFRDTFGADTETFLTFNGTGANVLALQVLLPKYGAVICAAGAHIDVDETGAPERILGAKLIPLRADNGKLLSEQITEFAHFNGVQHHVQPSVVSVTQSTELGTLYSVDELAQLVYVAHENGMLLHVDGARMSNAAAALGVSLKAITFDVGVDALSFGGTKNGMVGGEAVVFKDRATASGAVFLRKQTTQLSSKMRFISAQFIAMLENELWLRSAIHANNMAQLLDSLVRNVTGVTLERPTLVNSLFPLLPPEAIAPLQEWAPHYTWNQPRNQVRWVTSFDTTAEDVTRFAAGVTAACSGFTSHG